LLLEEGFALVVVSLVSTYERAVMTLLESTLLEWNVYHWGPLFYSEARNAEDSDASRKSRKE